MKSKLLAATSVALFAVAAPAFAAKGTYAGDVTDTTGHIALDVKMKDGAPTKLAVVRGDKIPSTCEVSGPIPEVSFNRKVNLAIDPDTGKFKGNFKQPEFGNVSTIKGTFDGEKVSGKIRIDYHYEAEQEFPEEDCDTGKLAFTAKLGARDEVAPDAG